MKCTKKVLSLIIVLLISQMIFSANNSEEDRIKKLKTSCVVVKNFPKGKISFVESIKSSLEKYYREKKGFNIVQTEISINILQNLNSEEMVLKLKTILPNIEQIIFGTINILNTPETRSTAVGRMRISTVRVIGELIIKVIEFSSMRINNNIDFNNYGLSTNSIDDAIHNLIFSFNQNIKTKLLEEREQSYFD